MRARSIIFWTLSLLTTLVFSLFMVTMLMVPGIMPGTKLWMLAVAGGAAAISLGFGVWRFRDTEIPVGTWPLGPVMGVLLLLMLTYCSMCVFMFATRTHH
jgi:hypothetical protein